jgi:membrane-associated HD superfamily phosphohydrolase
MSNPATTIKRWQIVIIIYTLCLALLALMQIPGEYAPPGSQYISIALGFAAAIFVIAIILLMNLKFKLGVIFLIFGGILTLPLGCLIIFAAIRIRSASERLVSEEFPSDVSLVDESKPYNA